MVITGGGTGIGAETARCFAEAGASRIALLGRREQPLFDTKASIQEKFPKVEVVVASADITKQSEVHAAFAKFAGDGKIHVLVSNAAMVGPQEPVRDVNADKFVESVHQNIRGSFLVAQVFLRHASPNAVAIEISVASAHLNIAPGLASYSVAKLAIFRLWDSLAIGNPEISVFHLQPGIVDTAVNKEVGGIANMGFEDNGKFNNRLLSRMPYA